MLRKVKTTDTDEVADNILAAVPEPVSLVKKEKEPEPESDPEPHFSCAVQGTSTGWKLTIKSDLDKHRAQHDSWSHKVYYPLDKYGERTKSLSICDEKSAKYHAINFLQQFRKSYERCKIMFLVDENDKN